MGKLTLNTIILDAFQLEDCFQINLLDGSVLSVYNPCFFEGVSLSDLKGCTLKEINEDEATKLVVLVLDKGTVHVNVHPDAWTGPEAMTLRGPSHSIVIWN